MVDSDRDRSLVDLARDATQVRRPAAALRAVRLLRARLDDLEAYHVESALERGWSWAQVAAALGVSRQAAHKRHAHRLGRGERVTVTAAARRVVQRARAEAVASGHARVGLLHVLLALFHPDAAAAATALARLGITPELVRAELPPPGRRRPRPAISAEVKRALEQSLREAVRAGGDQLRPEHLLLALLRQPEGAAVRVLGRAGVHPTELERRVAA